MTTTRRTSLEFERRLLEHPRAYHLRRMRMAIWLYLALLTRLPSGDRTLTIDFLDVAQDLGIPEGTVRSWLGHLRRMQYLRVERLNGSARVTVSRLGLPEPPPAPKPKFFTVKKLERALGEADNAKLLEGAEQYPDEVIKRSLAGALAVPESGIRKSRTALFIFLLKKYANPQDLDSEKFSGLSRLTEPVFSRRSAATRLTHAVRRRLDLPAIRNSA